MDHSTDKNAEKHPISGQQDAKNPQLGTSKQGSIFPSIGQQTALMLAWGIVMIGFIIWIVTARGPELIDIDHAEFRQTRFLVDINSAGPSEFSCLPGIGKKTAASIVSFREQNGPFKNVESMAEVPGVSKRLLNSLKSFLYIAASKELADDHRGIP